MGFFGRVLLRARAGRTLLPSRRLLLVGLLLVVALALRVDGIARPSVAARELYGALLSRQYYYGDGDGLTPAKQQVVRKLGTVFNPIEPPVLNLVSAAGFHVTGGESLWLPRLLSSILWVVGGIFLYLIAIRITTSGGALVALALYLFWPFGVWISRRGMPDALLVALLLAAALVVIRYWERPSSRRLLAAGVVSSFATAAKPGVALIFLVVLFVALAVSQRALVTSLTRGRLPLFVVLGSTLSAVYYVYGNYVRHFLSGESNGRIVPQAVAHARFWHGWWSMISSALPFPQQQVTLALLPILAALLGIAVARPGAPRAILIGLLLGYVVLGLTFTEHISTHSYYSLPLIAILALSIGSLAGFLLNRSSLAASALLIGLFVAGVGVAIYKSDRVLTSENPAVQIDDYRRVGEITGHTTRALVIDPDLISSICYWGWMVGRYWYEPSPAQDLPVSDGPLPPGIDPRQYSFLIVMETSELRTEPELRRFTRRLPVVARTDRYAIFDLRGWRPARSSP
jgi:4-amino-4-deoxy-L-arabinose transferase-like glycosyltransferase